MSLKTLFGLTGKMHGTKMVDDLKKKAAITQVNLENNKKKAHSDHRYCFACTARGITTYHRIYIKAFKRALHERGTVHQLVRKTAPTMKEKTKLVL